MIEYIRIHDYVIVYTINLHMLIYDRQAVQNKLSSLPPSLPPSLSLSLSLYLSLSLSLS